MKRVLVFAVLLGVGFSAWPQKVGLVLSGGAAKGIAHLGVIKALEENDIPVDYIVGTSMGGIIGGCYAAGMTPDEIERLILSEDFLRWVNGLPERGHNYYNNKKSPTPDFVSVNLNLDSALSFQFASNIASDVSLNFALAEFMAQASEASGQNFDSLFIPLRLLASDIFTQSQVVLARGSLADGLRATQAVPFFYSPIRIDGKYLFDGGIYNNFPVDVAQNEFHPEVVIGSNVSSKIFTSYPHGEDDKLISNSLLYMLLDNSDPEAVIRNGVYLQPNVTEFSSFDFSRARALIDSGYRQTLSQMEEIRKRVTRRTSASELTLRREQFHSQKKPLVIDAISFTGFNPHQQKYIQRMFKYKPGAPAHFSINQIKSGYFKLVSEPYFTSIYPSLLPNSESDQFKLNLSQRPQKNFQIDIGGVLVSRNLSNIFMGLNYYHFNKALSHTSFTLQTGSFYKSVIGRVRVDFPFFGRFYLEPEAFFNEWDYVESTDLLQQVSPTVLRRFDRRVGMSVGWPIASRLKATLSAAGFNNDDRYSNDRKFVSGDTLDQLKFRGFKGGFALTTNDMDRKQYPSSGKAFTLAIDYFNGKEIYEAGSTSETPSQSQYREWFRLTVSAEQYFRAGWYRPGYLARAVFSNQPAFSNYTGTVVNAPAFYPLQDSPTLVNENLRAFNYLAAGLRNVFILKPNLLDFRLEGYAFKPIEQILEGTNQEVVLSAEASDLFFVATAGPVVHTPIGPISLSVNYYDDAENTWGVLLHVGFLMFNKHTVDQ